MLASTNNSGTKSEMTPTANTPISSKITEAKAIVFQTGPELAREMVARRYTKALSSDKEYETGASSNFVKTWNPALAVEEIAKTA
jgi:hypothetical protein